MAERRPTLGVVLGVTLLAPSAVARLRVTPALSRLPGSLENPLYFEGHQQDADLVALQLGHARAVPSSSRVETTTAVSGVVARKVTNKLVTEGGTNSDVHTYTITRENFPLLAMPAVFELEDQLSGLFLARPTKPVTRAITICDAATQSVQFLKTAISQATGSHEAVVVERTRTAAMRATALPSSLQSEFSATVSGSNGSTMPKAVAVSFGAAPQGDARDGCSELRASLPVKVREAFTAENYIKSTVGPDLDFPLRIALTVTTTFDIDAGRDLAPSSEVPLAEKYVSCSSDI